MFKFVGDGAFSRALKSYIKMTVEKMSSDSTNILSNKIYDWVVLCVPSYALPEIEIEPDKKYILVSKGMIKIDDDNSALVTEWAESKNLDYVYLAGPHMAYEVENYMPSITTIASSNNMHFYELEQYFPGPIYTPHTHLSALGGVVKNIVSYGCGLYAALQLGENFNASVITAGIKEFINVSKRLNLYTNCSDIMSPSIVADIILTANSRKSRNFMAGFNHSKRIKSEHTVEAIHSSIELIKRIGYSQKGWPIISIVTSMIDGDMYNTNDLMEAWREAVDNLRN